MRDRERRRKKEERKKCIWLLYFMGCMWKINILIYCLNSCTPEVYFYLNFIYGRYPHYFASAQLLTLMSLSDAFVPCCLRNWQTYTQPDLLLVYYTTIADFDHVYTLLLTVKYFMTANTYSRTIDSFTKYSKKFHQTKNMKKKTVNICLFSFRWEMEILLKCLKKIVSQEISFRRLLEFK